MAEYYHYDSNGSSPNRGGGNNNGSSEFWSWVVIIAALSIFWPVGLFLLFRKLVGYTRRAKWDKWKNATRQSPGAQAKAGQQKAQTAQQTEAPQQQAQTAQTARKAQAGGTAKRRGKPLVPIKGKGLTIAGAITAGVGALSTLGIVGGNFFYLYYYLGELFFSLGIVGVGLVLLAAGLSQTRKSRRFRKYLSLIGKQTSLSIDSLAKAMPVSFKTACSDLQDMIDLGYLPAGYIDFQRGRLVFSEEGLMDDADAAAKAKEAADESERVIKNEEDENAILLEIRLVNDAIADEEMSRKIDRIGEITGKILDYQRKNPGKASQLRSFLNYYLPTTLKVLRAYAQLEAQGIEGENITAAKVRIESMMDKVVEGFEKQLDKLFQNDALDITTDVAVLEQMLDNDGLSSGGGMTMSL